MTRCQGPVMALGDKISLSSPELHNRVYLENDEPHVF